MESEETGIKIIITSKEQTYAFDKMTYRDDLLQNIIPKIEYDKIIDQASKIMGHSWTKKRVNDQIKLPKSVIILSLVAILLTIIYMILLYISVNSDHSVTLFVISIILISIGSAIAFGLSLYNFCRKIDKFKSLEDIIKEDIEQYLFQINKNFINKLEFTFNISKRRIEVIINPGKKVYNTTNFKKHVKEINLMTERSDKNAENSKKNTQPIFQSRPHALTNPEGNKSHRKSPSMMDKIFSNFQHKSSTIPNKKQENIEISSNQEPLKDKNI